MDTPPANLFFIVGAPRSGTTLLQQALNRHTRVAIPPETAFFTLLTLGRARRRQHLARINSDLGIDLLDPVRRHVPDDEARLLYHQLACQYLERLGRPGDTHFGEKSPEHQRRLPLLRRLFPGAKIVLIYRDGRDVACRLARLPWMSADVYVNFALWLHYYRIQQRLMAERSPHVYFLRYEDLVARPAEELRKVLDFLGLDYEARVAEGDGNRDGVPDWERSYKGHALEKISGRYAGQWRGQLSPRQIAVMERWGGVALRTLGYELTTDGKAPLPPLFYPRVYAKSLFWVMTRPRYATAKDNMNWQEKWGEGVGQTPPARVSTITRD